MKLFQWILISLTLVGCATTNEFANIIENGKTERIDYPERGTVVEGFLGNTLVEKGYKTTVPGIEVVSGGCVGSCGAIMNCENRVYSGDQKVPMNLEVPASRGRQNLEARCGVIQMKAAPGAAWNCGSSTVNWFVCKDSLGWFSPSFQMGMGKNQKGLELTGKFKEVDLVDVDQPSFKQEFIYNGRYEDNLKFVYREFSEDLARPAFSQEVQYDLSEDSMVGFKNLLLEVVEATNTKIRYKVIQTF